MAKADGKKRVSGGGGGGAAKGAPARSGKGSRTETPPRAKKAAADAAGIPALNLSEQILAQERKRASDKRKGPKGKTAVASGAAVVPPTGSPVGNEATEPSRGRTLGSAAAPPVQPIISQIVRRDIERLRKRR